MSHHTVEDGELHRQVRKGEIDNGVSHRTGKDGELNRQVREGEREIVVCPIIPWRMGNYTDR